MQLRQKQADRFSFPNEKILEVEIYRPADSHVKRYLSLHLLIGEIEIIWPVSGKITSHYGLRNSRKHDGVDISVHKGTHQ